ncbi:MAG: ATP synthase subunit I [Burkholderiales bacterium]
MNFRLPGRPARVILFWQILFLAAVAPLAAYLGGTHGVVSVVLGGSVGIGSAAFFFLLMSTGKKTSAGDVLLTAFRAEAAKIVFIVVALWMILTTYKDVVVLGFIASFVATILISTMALFVRPD